MNKFIKYLYALAIGIVAISFPACGGDDNDGPDSTKLLEQMQGHWSCTHMDVSMFGQTITMNRQEIEDFANSQGFSNISDAELDINGSKANGYPFTLRGNKLTYDDLDAYNGITITVDISGSTMTLRCSIYQESVNQNADLCIYYSKSRAKSPVSVTDCIENISLYEISRNCLSTK